MVFRFVQPYDDPDRSQKLTSSFVSRGQAINAESDVEIRLQLFKLRHSQMYRKTDTEGQTNRLVRKTFS